MVGWRSVPYKHPHKHPLNAITIIVPKKFIENVILLKKLCIWLKVEKERLNINFLHNNKFSTKLLNRVATSENF